MAHKISMLLLAAVCCLTPASMAQEALNTPTTVTPDSDPEVLSKIRTAMLLLEDKDYIAGLDMLAALGEARHKEAFYHLGEVYRLGLAGDRNLPMANMYYRLAAGLGHKRAGLSLANLLYFDMGNEKANQESALALWQQNAILGEPEALYMTGMLYWNGEAGLSPDPVRGYGLIWSAVQKGYTDAIDAEQAMLPMVQIKARQVARDYATRLPELGFSDEPLAMDLMLESMMEMAPAAPAAIKRPMPEDWDSVWSLEVGFALAAKEVEKTTNDLLKTQEALLQELHIVPRENPARPGVFKLAIGPMKSMRESVTVCVALKRAGHDCFAKAPE